MVSTDGHLFFKHIPLVQVVNTSKIYIIDQISFINVDKLIPDGAYLESR